MIHKPWLVGQHVCYVVAKVTQCRHYQRRRDWPIYRLRLRRQNLCRVLRRTGLIYSGLTYSELKQLNSTLMPQLNSLTA